MGLIAFTCGEHTGRIPERPQVEASFPDNRPMWGSVLEWGSRSGAVRYAGTLKWSCSDEAEGPSRDVRFVRALYHRFAALLHELTKFGIIGGLAFVIDTATLNLFHLVVGFGPMTSKVLATTVSTTFAYAGNRFWTFRHREQSGLGREYFLFFLMNGIALLFGVLVIGFTTYTLKLNDPLSLNVANIVGVGLGTLFRYWSYKKWVFLEATTPIPAELPEVGVRQDR
jgi:putative flippase GtrA